MKKTLLAVAALCIVSCFCAPITTPPPAEPATATAPSVNEDAIKSGSSLAYTEDVMMDPTAKMSWQKQEGDITFLTDKFLFPEDPNDPFFERPTTDSAQRSKRAAVRNRYKLWTNGVVPYVISDAYTASERDVLIQAMDHWENHTCIRFVPRTTQRDYVSFFPGWGCYSYVGRVGGNQGISVGRRCFAVFVAVHEIGHAIGYYHEQSRPDRDEHVQIIGENIANGAHSEFEKYTNDRVDSYGVGYDYNSIMHYDATLFSRNGKPTIIALDPDIPLGKARVLSALDIEQTKRLYHCPATPPPRSTVAPKDDNAGFKNFPSTLPYPECGGFFTSLSGTIESPGFPQYTHNVDCGWFFKMPQTGFNILFDFEPFNVEESPDCESDYIQLYESLDTSGYTGGKKCGNNYSFFPLSTLTSYAYLHFHTNGSNETPNLKGFKLKYSAVDVDECHPLWKQCSHGCRNFEGGFECSCPDGFFMSSDGKNCFDVNECGLDKGGCDHKCINMAGTYQCACDEGYTLARDNKTCIGAGTADLCAEANCQHPELCQVVNSAAKCRCPSGYLLGLNQKSCIDINECLSNKGNCQHQCRNTDGSYVCACDSGYELQSNGRSCVRTDPCALNNGGCQHVCTSWGGSQVCTCRSGYKLDNDGVSCNDINECAINDGKGDCGHTCTNTPGSRVCSCPTGYQLLSDGVSCQDIDECQANNGDCGLLHCINKEGSHECGCRDGFKLREDSNGCAEILQGPSGTISSGNWPETYPVNVNLQWVIQCESNQRVDLTFSPGFGIASAPPDCPKDWLKVYDGDSMSSNLFGKFCHYTLPQVPRSSSNTLLIHFYAGPNHNPARKGFELSYTCVDVALPTTTVGAPTTMTESPTTTTESPETKIPVTQSLIATQSRAPKPEVTEPAPLPEQPAQCGKTLFTESSGTIETPNWPSTYPTNVQCEYFIQLPDENSAVEISFSGGFRIAGQYPACDKDWVKVYDGHSDDGHLHGRYCNINTPPSLIKTAGSKAKIVLYAGPAHNPSRTGFSATYRSVSP